MQEGSQKQAVGLQSQGRVERYVLICPSGVEMEVVLNLPVAWVATLELMPTVDPHLDDALRLSHLCSLVQGILRCRVAKKRSMKISIALGRLMKRKFCFARLLEKVAVRSWVVVHAAR
eukprot:c40801_g1_i1 orf=125-478(+)